MANEKVAMFAISYNSLPRVDSYASALEVYQKAPCIGEVSGRELRGLHGKRDKSKSVFMWRDDVTFRFHSTDMVTWHSEDEVTVTAHDTVSSRIFLEMLTPKGINVRSRRRETCFNNHVPKRGRLTFKRVAPETWETNLADVEQPKAYRVDRAIARNVRKALAPFVEWRQAYEALTQKPLSTYTDGTIPALMTDSLRAGYIDPANYLTIARANIPYTDLTDTAIVFAGGVTKVLLPFGETPPKSRYERWSHRINMASTV